MEKYFICLANSYKHGGRCIAGVEAEYDGKRWVIKRDEFGMPVWIRPVSNTSPTEEISNHLALNIHILDVVRLTGVIPVPKGAQKENVTFNSMITIGKNFLPRVSVLERLMNDHYDFLFFNSHKNVEPLYYNEKGDHSIILLRTDHTIVYCDKSNMEKPKYRVNFQYNNQVYDLPITDPAYLEDLKSGRKSIGDKGTIFITCSLGIEHEGMHYKLAACIIEPIDQPKPELIPDEQNWFAHYDKELSRLIDEKYEIETKIKLLRLKLQSEMEQRRINIGESDMLKVSYMEPKTVLQFDRERFLHDFPQLYEQYLVPKQREAHIVVKRKNAQTGDEADSN